MKASFIIGFHTQRLDNLLQTLRFLHLWHADTIKDCELITVCQDKTSRNIYSQIFEQGQNFQSNHNYYLDLPCMHLPYVTNFGVDKASCDKLIILESDRILPEGYFASVIDQLEEGVQITPKRMYKLLKPFSDEEIASGDWKWADPTEELPETDFKAEFRNEGADPGERNMWSGNTALMKSDYYKAGGMDEYYKGYGWADCDMTLRMEKAGVQSIYRDEIEIHLWHPAMTYGDGDQKQMFTNNGIYFCIKWQQPFPIFLRKDIANRKHALV